MAFLSNALPAISSRRHQHAHRRSRSAASAIGWRVSVFSLLGIGVLGGLQPVEDTIHSSPHHVAEVTRSGDRSSSVRHQTNFGKLPLYFIENQGQLDARVAYYLQGRDTTLYFTPQGITFTLSETQSQAKQDLLQSVAWKSQERQEETPQRWVLKLDFVGANTKVRPEGTEKTSAIVSYFRGTQDQWLTGLPTYRGVRYPDLWPGIDLVYSGTGQELKYTFVVKPGADPQHIQLAYQGATTVHVTDDGQLAVTTPIASFTDARPFAYQERDGRQEQVEVTYELAGNSAAETHGYGFRVAHYDPNRELIIDPAILVYSGFIGGNDTDVGESIAVDSVGAAYIAGWANSTQGTFPETVGPDLTQNLETDAFVAKVNAAGTALIYAGYIGGTARDLGGGVAVDATGAAYVVGETPSTQTSFPETVGPDLTSNGGIDAFVAKVAPNGATLAYAGFVGGDGTDTGYGIAVDSTGAAYLTGITDSTDLPVTGGLVRPVNPVENTTDAFVVKVNSAGTGFNYVGYVGGRGNDIGYGIAVDSTGAAYITGETDSSQATDAFPVTIGPDTTYNLNGDAFVAKVNSAGSAFVYLGYIGGSGIDIGYGIAVDNTGAAYVTGETNSTQTTFPVLGGPDTTYNGGAADAFVAKINVAGSGRVYTGYIGGSGTDRGFGIAVDSTGAAYVTGATNSTQPSFPVLEGPDLTHNGMVDAFVTKVETTGLGLVYAGFIGGSQNDFGYGIAVDSTGAAYITGETLSTQAAGFPVLGGPDLTHNGQQDAFVAKIASPLFTPLSVFRPSQGRWFFDNDLNGVSDFSVAYGVSTDIPVPGDYNGDDVLDLAVFRPSAGRWFVDFNRDGVTDISVAYGINGDIPVPADYNGDGIVDFAVWRPSQRRWFVDTDRNGTTNISAVYGVSGDIPVPADYNGDAIADFAMFRPSTGQWFVDTNRNGTTEVSRVFGINNDIPVPGDYNGDGNADFAVWRRSIGRWFVDTNRNGTTDIAVTYGISSDIPVPNDYDVDGATDFAVWRPSQGRWFIDLDLNGATNIIVVYGVSTDKPLRPNGWILTTLGVLPQ